MSMLFDALAGLWGFLTHLFDTSDFPERWNCGNWSAGNGWLHILSDLGVWSAYVAIPMVLLFFVYKRRNLPFRMLFVLFGAFILFCGTTHLMEAIIFWWPAYRLAGVIKLATAIVSWATVFALVPIAPRALAMKSPDELEETVRQRTRELEHEIQERKLVEQQLLEQRRLLKVTLSSIGDAVMATGRDTRITFHNAVAEKLTGWPAAEALGRPLAEVFQIVNERTGQTVESPCDVVLREGRTVGLANHTLLIARDGRKTPIDDSAAPIRDESGDVLGVVLVFRDATDERQFVETRVRLAAIVESSQDAIIGQDMNGIILSWNGAAEELFGYTPEEAIGQPISMIVPPELKHEAVESLARIQRGEKVEYHDTVRLHKSGDRLDVSSRISPIRDGDGEVIGASKTSHGISQRKHSERVLRLLSEAGGVLSALNDESDMLQRLARLAVSLFADWCVIHRVDGNGRIECMTAVHRRQEKELVLQEILAHYPLDWNVPSVAVSVLRSGQPDLVSDVPGTLLDAIARDEQHRRWIAQLNPRSTLTVPIMIRDRCAGSIQFVAADEARRFTLNDLPVAVELARRAATAVENVRLYQELKEAQRQKDDFLAMLAHELRNPLAAIQYANQLNTSEGHANRAATETIDRQVKSLAHLIDDLLDVSRITRDKIRLKREHIDGAVLARRAASSAQQLVDQRKHVLALELDEGPLPLDVDATRVEQILINLLSNAAKYTPEGGRITLRCRAEAGQVVYRVRDTGIGIPRDMLPHVFELFTQVDKSLDRSQGGLGIGLTVVRRLAELLGGNVAAHSEGLGRGSEFVVRLPLAEPAAEAQSPPLTPAALGRTLRMLVVDDNIDTAQSMAALLRVAGHEVHVAHDGRAALEMAASIEPEVMLLDIGLPGLDGYQVAQALRADPAARQPRLIAISGYGQPQDRRRALEAGFDEHLVKPVAFDKLLALLASV